MEHKDQLLMELVKKHSIDNVKGPDKKCKLYNKVLVEYNTYFDVPWEKEVMMNRIHHLRKQPGYQANWIREKRAKETMEKIGIQSFSINYHLPLPQLHVGNSSLSAPPLDYKKKLPVASLEKK